MVLNLLIGRGTGKTVAETVGTEPDGSIYSAVPAAPLVRSLGFGDAFVDGLPAGEAFVGAMPVGNRGLA